MLNRHAWLRASTIEGLERRAVLSVVAPIRSAPIDPPDADRVVAEVASSAAVRPVVRPTVPEPGGGDQIGVARTGRSGPGNLPASSPGVRSNPTGSGAARRPVPSDQGLREFPDPLSLIRHNEPAIVGDPAANGPEMMSGTGGTAFDPAGATPLVGWAPSASVPVVISLVNPPDRVAGGDGRATTAPGSRAAITTPAASVNNIGHGPEDAESVAGDVLGSPGVLGDGVHPPRSTGLGSDPRAFPPAWAGLIDGALQPDWEGVDGDLRQFLARLGGLADTPGGPGSWPTWAHWIAATTALLLARRASSGPRRLFGRPAAGAVWVSARRPVPIGPWPLGPP